jgi:hypothetical protein
VKKKKELLLSKRFIYSLIVLVLIFFICLSLYEAHLGNDLAARFLPTLCGLLVTFGIFTVFFDVREELEWKEVEDRVKKRIGSEIFTLFKLLTDFCEVDKSLASADRANIEKLKELERKQLEQMTGKVVLIETLLSDLLEKKDLAANFASLFDSIRIRISEIEGKYGRFLNPKLRVPLMDIQDCLDELRFELKLGSVGSAERLHQSLSTIIEKIIKEINNVRGNGIDIGF